MKSITLYDKTFVPYIKYRKISDAVRNMAKEINADNADATDVPIILCVMNGAMMFTAELMKELDFNCELYSIKLKSYSGTKSTGKVKTIQALPGPVTGRRVYVCEDIVDSGNTIRKLRAFLLEKGAADVKICAMLRKPDICPKDIQIDYLGMDIENRFIVGFGLDYNELGRNLKDIYVLK